MPYKNLVIHSIEKEQFSDQVHTIKSTASIEIEGESIENFCNSLKESYKNDNRISNTRFAEDSIFKKTYDIYLKGCISFVECSSELIDLISVLLKTTKSAKGGKFVFMEEKTNRNTFYYIFLIRDTKGGQIEYSEESSKYILNSVEYADTNNLAMSARINQDIYKNATDNIDLNYLSFTYSGTKQSVVSAYFSNWLGVTKLHKDNEYASALKKAIMLTGDYVDDGYSGTATEKLQLVLHYVQAKNDEIVNIYSLSEYLYGTSNRNLIRNKCDENNLIFTERFKLTPASKNLFQNISVKVSEIRLQFPRTLLEKKIIQVSDGKVVIYDAPLADKIQKS